MKTKTKTKSNIDSAKAFMEEMNLLAEELYGVRQGLNTHEERFKKETDDLYSKEANLKSQLLERLKAVGLKSVKVASGDSWYISKRTGVEIKNEVAFIRWTLENKLVQPDKERVKDFLKKLAEKNGDIPSCVELTTRDSISIKKQKENVVRGI